MESDLDRSYSPCKGEVDGPITKCHRSSKESALNTACNGKSARCSEVPVEQELNINLSTDPDSNNDWIVCTRQGAARRLDSLEPV